MDKKALFSYVLKQFEDLNVAWNNYFKGKNLTHFDGVFQMYYIDSRVVNQALEIIKLNFEGKGHEDKSEKINQIRVDLSQMDNLFFEFLYHEPVEIQVYASWLYEFFDKYAEGTAELDVAFLTDLSLKLENLSFAGLEK